MWDSDLDSSGGFYPDYQQGQDGQPPEIPPATQGTTDWIPDGHGSYMPPQSQWPVGKQWDPKVAGFVDAAAPPVTQTGPATGGPAPGSIANMGGVQGTGFQQPATSWDPSAWSASMPGFHPPTFQKPPAFEDPDYATVLGNDKGYQFGASEGLGRMQASQAARGVINGGGSLKDIAAWATDYASQGVNDARNRARDTYMLNYGTQYVDPFKYAYQSALDSYQGQMGGWQTQGEVGQRQGETDWMHEYTPWNDTWNRRIQVGLS